MESKGHLLVGEPRSDRGAPYKPFAEADKPQRRHSGTSRSDGPGMTTELVRQNLGQEFLRAVAARLGEEIGLVGILHDLTLIHEDDAVGDLAGKAHLVRHDHHGHALTRE